MRWNLRNKKKSNFYNFCDCSFLHMSLCFIGGHSLESWLELGGHVAKHRETTRTVVFDRMLLF